MILKTLIKISNQQIILPFYHLVTTKNPNYIKHLYTPKNSNQFKEELAVLLKYYQPISLKELVEIKKNNKQIKQPVFHLTFDDGLQNFYQIISPILLAKKIPATVFLNTNFIDNKELFYRYKVSLLIEHYYNSNNSQKQLFYNFLETKDVKKHLLSITFQDKELLDQLAIKVNFSFQDFLEHKKPYLTLNQIKELQKKGFTFGAHSVDHPFYADITLKEQLKQTTESINFIKNNLKTEHVVFSFPFSDIGVRKTFFNKIEDKVDLCFGTSGLKNDEISFNLHRLDMEKSKQNTKQFLINNFLKYFIKTFLGKNIIIRK